MKKKITSQYLNDSQAVLIHRVSGRHRLYCKYSMGFYIQVLLILRKKKSMNRKFPLLCMVKYVIGYDTEILDKHK